MAGGAGLAGTCPDLRGPALPTRPQIPRSYLSLQAAVLAEHQRRSLSDDVQYLTDRQLEQLMEQTPGNDIRDYEDLQSGVWAGRAGRRRGPGGHQRAWAPSPREGDSNLSPTVQVHK